MLTIDSSREVSTRCPRPVRCRASSASRIPCAEKIPAEQIADRDSYPRRTALLGAGHAHQTRHSLCDLIEARKVAQRPGRAEPRDAACNDARVARRQILVIESNRLHHAGPEVIDNYVGGVDEPHQDFATLWFFDRDAETFLRPIRAQKKIIVAALALPHLAARILDGLDLEDRRAVIAENLRAEWPRKIPGQIDHLDSVKRGSLLIHCAQSLPGDIGVFLSLRNVCRADPSNR